MKKNVTRGLLALVLVGSLAGTTEAFAAASVDVAPSIVRTEDTSTRAEKTKWYFRDNNGTYEKRLWSITEGVWLTDWIPV